MAFQPAKIPAAKVELSVSCRDLLKKDATSKSDPMCVLYMCEFGTSKFTEVARTEMIKDTLNPDFVEKFILEYRFEEQQKLKFAVYDVDSSSAKVKHHDALGEYYTSLGVVVSSRTTNARLSLKDHSHNAGHIKTIAEEMAACNDVLNIQICGSKLDKKDVFGKSDPFLVIYKSNPDQSFTAVHKTEVIKNTLDPVWREFSVPVATLCNGDWDRTLKLECYDWDSDGSSHDSIGSFLTCVRELSQQGKTFELINPKKQAKKKSYNNSGTISVNHVRMTKQYGFLDYISAGVQLNFTVAVDFTGSNGDPRDPRSLHYIDNAGLNQYATAILSVGNVIQDYDSDKMFPALGFGGKLPDGTVSHEFYLNGDPSNPFCAGIGGVMQAYQNAIRTVELWGPTNFSPVINHVARFAETMRDGTNYFVLLIITDGLITDFPETLDAIFRASKLPVSIIIVGVGEADFSGMELLDGDDEWKKCKERDIVQFVPLGDYLSTGDPAYVQAKLAKDVLAEVPGQFLSYMRKHNIQPPQQLVHHSLAPQAMPTPTM